MRGESSIAAPLQVYLPVFAAEALNSTITDVDGNTFIDFAGGVGVCNVGHCHPRVVEAPRHLRELPDEDPASQQ